MKLSFRKYLPVATNGTKHSDIVFIHGTGSNSHMWQNQISFFTKRGHTCITIDLRGHGKTHEPREATNIKIHLNDLTETLLAAQVKFPAYFVGHSLGAILSCALVRKKAEWVKGIFAASLPTKVAPLVVSTFQVFLNGPIQAIKQIGLHNHFPWRERTLIEMPLFTLKQIAIQFGGANLTEGITEITCPIHFAAGRFDPVALYPQVLKIHNQIPGSTLHTFEWGGHNFMDANPDEFNHWIAKYISTSE